MKTFLLFIRLARLPFLLGGLLLYALGAGIAHHVGITIDWGIYWAGQAWGIMLHLGVHFLNEYFDFHEDTGNTKRSLLTGGSGALGAGKLPRATAFWLAIACLAVTASLTVLIIWKAHPNTATIIFMALIGLGGILYSVPPVRLASSGYGELTSAILFANMAPGFAFFLQSGDLNRLLAMVTFPLTPLALAMLLALELPDYATDLKYGKRTLMVRIGWQAGMNLHNLLILSSYLLLALAIVLGLPMYLAWPAFLTLPIAGLQIWMMNRIAAGARPNWFALALVALVTFSLTSYLLAYSFWIN